MELHPQLAQDTFPVTRLTLCQVLLMDNAHFPWLIMVPKRDNITEITDLSAEEQTVLMKEINLVSKTLQQFTNADKMNIAALGNQVPQLHIHVIARFKQDPTWPNPVWGVDRQHYKNEQKDLFISGLSELLRNNN